MEVEAEGRGGDDLAETTERHGGETGLNGEARKADDF